jgi:single-strand DNA-binding protein
MLPSITIDGRLVADPELRFTQGGKAVCSLRVAASDSKKDDNGNWDTTEQIFVGVSLWEAEGEAAAETLQKGDQVLVSGRIFEREYDKNDGTKGRSLEVKFPTVAKKVSAPRVERQSAPAGGLNRNDPWASVAPRTDEPPF